MNNLTNKAPAHAKKILLCFAALALILACVPSTPAAVPTLDQNGINLLIQQTANAASTQTMAALPTRTSTAAFTLTPIDTLTPEATNTPFVTFVVPTPTKLQRVQFFRVKHDTQLAVFNFKSRTADSNWPLSQQTPETVPLFVAPKLGAGTHRTTITDAWENYMDALNGFDNRKLKYLKADNTALFNNAGFPQLESLTMGGNVITLNEIQGSWGRVNTMDYGQVGSAETENYGTRPDIVHKFVLVVWSKKNKSTYWSTTTPQGALYWPLVSSKPVWIPMDRLEPFPTLPMPVTASIEQEIQYEPGKDGARTGETLAKGESVTITQYFLSGSQVWGRLQGGKWIALFRYEKEGPTFFTSWKMETLPPP
jgi:hypothetical protein